MKVHIIGISGSGKTTLAQWFGTTFDIRNFELDSFVYDRAGGNERKREEIDRQIESVLQTDGWVTEGHYRDDWIRPLLDEAHVVVWLETPLFLCAVRVLKRNLWELIIATNYSRWLRFIRFLHYTFGRASIQKAETKTLLSAYEEKVFRCRSQEQVDALKARLMYKH